MLVLTREKHESIVIADCIEVMILGVQGGKVRLGVTAPANITIHRKEIQLRIEESRKEDTNGTESNLSGRTS